MMKTTVVFLCLTLLMPVLAQTHIIDETEREAVISAARDYMEGAHAGDASRIERSCHPEFSRVSVHTFPQTGRQSLYKEGYTKMLEMVRVHMMPWPKATVGITPFAVTDGIASVLAESPMFHDYLHLIKVDDGWKLIQACTRRKIEPGVSVAIPDEENEALRQAALDYIEGWFVCDPDRMERAVHPALHKVQPIPFEKTGKTMVNHVPASFLIEGARAKVGALDEGERNVQIKILDIQPDIAAVEVVSSMYFEYLHLAKLNEQWKIVNVLWIMNPEASNS